MTIPLLKPKLPPLSKLSHYINQIDANRVYSNFGPLERDLCRRLATQWNLGPDTVTTTANATLGLIQALWGVTGGPSPTGGLCMLPAWTFTASASAVVAAGLTPFFIDVDPHTWAITPQIADQALKQASEPVKVVMVVSPFGMPLNLEAWDLWAARTGIPVVIDAAAAFDTIRPAMSPCVVSFHATKVFGAGEGGCIVSRDPSLITRIKQFGSFGFNGDRTSHIPGINTKLSEHSAALALAALDAWPVTRTTWFNVAQHYRRRLVAQFGRFCDIQPGWGHTWITSTLNLRLYHRSWQDVQEHLAEQDIESRPWWNGVLPTHPAYADYPRTDMNNAITLAQQVIGLPFFMDLSISQIDSVCQALDELYSG